MSFDSLEARLQRLAQRQRSLRLWTQLAACWAGAGFLGLGLFFFERQIGWVSALSAPVVAAAGVFTALFVLIRHRRSPADRRELARMVEAHNPQLEGRLLTAIQQQPGPDGQFHYLQQRLLQEVLEHAQRQDWLQILPATRVGVARLAHALALVLLALVLVGLNNSGGHKLLARFLETSVSVSPGDANVERGNSLVVLARFKGPLPPRVELVLETSGQAAQHIPLVKSLADPIFGGAVPELQTNLVYHLDFAGQRTRDFKVNVFEYPRLERADADIRFPAYTRLAPKRVENTRRVSAVEGSRLELRMQLNKPVVRATLKSKDKAAAALPLLVATNRATANLKEFTLAKSGRYDLELVDAQLRTNKIPAQFVFDALQNRRPELHLASPRGDIRPSPLEEISFEGTVWDDFGIPAYGVGYGLAGQRPQFIELGRAVPANEKRAFKYLLRLEDLGVQPDQLVAWFVWAEDIGPNGETRRTDGDLFFGEVRPFDETFREAQNADGAGGGGQSGGSPSQTTKLVDLQKQLMNATWKLQREHATNWNPRPQQEIVPPQSRASRPRGVELGLAGAAVRAYLVNSPAPPIRAFGQVRSSEASSSKRGGPEDKDPVGNDSTSPRGKSRPAGAKGGAQSYEEDVGVLQDAQAQALEQARSAEGHGDPRTAALWRDAIQQMQRALAELNEAKKAPDRLPAALATEEAAYQALLKLQQHEYEVTRRRQGQSGSGRQEQMQQQLDELELTQSENRYETQRQAAQPRTPEARESLQVMSRLQELARRQQDLNERLKELQTALQATASAQERQELERRLKRLQEEEQELLGDVDELRQRMDRPENQSRMADERRQLDQTREDVHHAAQAAREGSVAQALASGTRAERQLQDLHDQMRKENSTQIGDDLRAMRADARELARQQEDILKKLSANPPGQPRSLSDSPEHQQALEELAKQKGRMTNLVDRATELSQQTEDAEPLASRQLYDSVRKFAQDSARELKEAQDDLMNRRLITSNLYEQLKDSSDADGPKLLDVTSELLRQGAVGPAAETAQRSRTGIAELRKGVERAAESVVGDDTEALRLAQEQLDQLNAQLQNEMAKALGASSITNTPDQTGAASAASRTPSPAGREGSPPQDAGTAAQAAPRQGGRTEPSDQGSSAQASAQDAGSGQGQNAERAQAGQAGGAQRGSTGSDQSTGGGARGGGDLNFGEGGRGGVLERWRAGMDQALDGRAGAYSGPITGEGYVDWSDRLRDVEELIEIPDLRNEVARARDRARTLRQEFKRDQKKPDWAVVRTQIAAPLAEVRDQITEELARRQSADALVPIDRDPVPARYSDLVRKYYEELGKTK